jgi:tyrosinase
MSEKAQAIAATYNNQTWINAAAKVRLPYWDWAATPKDWPYSLISESNVSVATPTGSRTVANPFATYKFKGQPYPASVFFPGEYLGEQKQTLRQPNMETNTTGDAQIAGWWADELGGIERNIVSAFP